MIVRLASYYQCMSALSLRNYQKWNEALCHWSFINADSCASFDKMRWRKKMLTEKIEKTDTLTKISVHQCLFLMCLVVLCRIHSMSALSTRLESWVLWKCLVCWISYCWRLLLHGGGCSQETWTLYILQHIAIHSY